MDTHDICSTDRKKMPEHKTLAKESSCLNAPAKWFSQVNLLIKVNKHLLYPAEDKIIDPDEIGVRREITS